MSFAKNLIFLVVIVGIIAGGIMYASRKDAEYINIRVNLTQLENISSPRIDNLTASVVPVSKNSEPKGTQPFSPGILVIIFQNEELISYWTSVPYNGTGTYDLPVGLTKYPKAGEFILINIRFLDASSTELNSLTYSTELK